MPTFNDPKALKKYLEKALGEAQRETIIATQKRLGDISVSPRDTGRFRSSWFANEGSASNAVAPQGADAPNIDAQGLATDPRKTYHLTNNLPYAATITLGVNFPPSWGGENRLVSAPATWFTTIRNQTIPELGDEALKTIKRRYDL